MDNTIIVKEGKLRVEPWNTKESGHITNITVEGASDMSSQKVVANMWEEFESINIDHRRALLEPFFCAIQNVYDVATEVV